LPLIIIAAHNLLSLLDVFEARHQRHNGGYDMTDARATVVPLRRPVRRRRIDLALALAVLGRAVRSHERARVTRTLLLVRPSHIYEHAKPLGA
jgi:hypothetical protein